MTTNMYSVCNYKKPTGTVISFVDREKAFKHAKYLNEAGKEKEDGFVVYMSEITLITSVKDVTA